MINRRIFAKETTAEKFKGYLLAIAIGIFLGLAITGVI